MPKIKIRCEATAKHSGKRCRCLGRFIPTSRRILCPYHKGGKSWDNKTRKYKGLYKNDKVPIQNKIKLLKNLKNFKDKTDDEIKRYIQDQEELASKSKRYRTKYYTRHYLRWRNTTYRNQRHLKDQLDQFLQILRSKPKV